MSLIVGVEVGDVAQVYEIDSPNDGEDGRKGREGHEAEHLDLGRPRHHGLPEHSSIQHHNSHVREQGRGGDGVRQRGQCQLAGALARGVLPIGRYGLATDQNAHQGHDEGGPRDTEQRQRRGPDVLGLVGEDAAHGQTNGGLDEGEGQVVDDDPDNVDLLGLGEHEGVVRRVRGAEAGEAGPRGQADLPGVGNRARDHEAVVDGELAVQHADARPRAHEHDRQGQEDEVHDEDGQAETLRLEVLSRRVHGGHDRDGAWVGDGDMVVFFLVGLVVVVVVVVWSFTGMPSFCVYGGRGWREKSKWSQ